MNKAKRKSLNLKLILLVLLLLAAATVLCVVLATPNALREDFKRISSEQYDSLFLSMYPVDTYSEEDFETYRELTLLKASYCIPEFPVLERYMKRIAKSGNTITTIYLGIRPELTDMERLLALFERYPSVGFEVILPYPSLSYWEGLPEEEYHRLLEAYDSFLTSIVEVTNAHFYFFGSQEWLTCNPGNYQGDLLVNEAIASTIMLHSDVYHEYLVTADNAQAFASDLVQLTGNARLAPQALPDLVDYRFVFFGDSVIGNYTDSSSIPGVVAGLSGAAVFNCGYGGNSATVNPDSPINLPGIAEAFAGQDLSALPADTQVYAGLSAYVAQPLPEKKLCVVINYGLNDYFSGYPLSSEADPYDVTTFCGAIRTSVATIRAAHPDATIILCTPSYCFYFLEGMDPRGEEGHIITEYVASIIALSGELQVELLDTYYDFGVDGSNWETYLLPDQVHPNMTYRYLIGKRIVEMIAEKSR